MRRILVLPLAIVISAPVAGQASKAVQPPAAMSAIREADIQRDLYALAGDAMRGREAGTVDEMRASMWIAEEMRKLQAKGYRLNAGYHLGSR